MINLRVTNDMDFDGRQFSDFWFTREDGVILMSTDLTRRGKIRTYTYNDEDGRGALEAKKLMEDFRAYFNVGTSDEEN